MFTIQAVQNGPFRSLARANVRPDLRQLCARSLGAAVWPVTCEGLETVGAKFFCRSNPFATLTKTYENGLLPLTVLVFGPKCCYSRIMFLNGSTATFFHGYNVVQNARKHGPISFSGVRFLILTAHFSLDIAFTEMIPFEKITFTKSGEAAPAGGPNGLFVNVILSMGIIVA